jgi:thioredoxin 2
MNKATGLTPPRFGLVPFAMADAQIVTCLNCGRKNRVAVAAPGIPRCGNCHEALPWIVEVSASDFDAAVDATVPVLVDFWAPWCAPCRMVTPAVESLGRAHAGRLKVVKLNIDTAPEIASRHQVQSIPLLVLLQNGSEVDRQVGAVPEPRLRAWLEPHLTATSGSATG